MKSGLLLSLLLSAFFTLPSYAKAKPAPLPQSIIHYVDKISQQYHFNRDKLLALMQQTHPLPKVVKRLNHPFEKKPWDFYRNYFITTERINHGVKYWHEHAKVLQQTSRKYGVPTSVIVAIIGIESHYGHHTGSFPELDTLRTLSFDQTSRTKFFKKELTQLLLLSRQQNLNILALTGSYAGAMGIPQFMPSSYRFYGVDYSHNHHIDLIHNDNDAIASIANYLAKSGWRAHHPVAIPAILKNTPDKKLISNDGRGKRDLTALAKLGIQPNQAIETSDNAALIAMHNTKNDEYWLVFPNFRAIMDYNPRTTYAMAVFQLSQRIEKQYQHTQSR